MSKRFLFHGNATPLGGRIVSIAGKPAHEPIPGPPSSSLGVDGGLHRSESKGSSHRNILSWGDTLAETKGELRADGHHITTVSSSVADVSVKNDPLVFKAKKLAVTMVADHDQTGEPDIAPREIVYGGLELDGEPIELEVDDDLARFPTFAAFEKEYRRNQDFFEKYKGRLIRGDSEAKFGERFPRTEGGYVLLSFVRSILWKKKKIKGHILPLKGFGKIHFGEVVMKSNRRRITLVRLAMGSTVGAAVTLACSDQNGSWGH